MSVESVIKGGIEGGGESMVSVRKLDRGAVTFECHPARLHMQRTLLAGLCVRMCECIRIRTSRSTTPVRIGTSLRTYAQRTLPAGSL